MSPSADRYDELMATLLSINIARPGTISWRGHDVDTGIFKEPVVGPVVVGRLGIAGDRQADLRVHGGPRKAVYLYPPSTTNSGIASFRTASCLPGPSVKT
jgi:MOSC domain-containing protein YiiM